MRHRQEYWQAYHLKHKEARNARKRQNYIPSGRQPGRPKGSKTRPWLAKWRERRLQELSQKTIVEIVTDPELLKLIEEQKKDDRTFMVKYDYSFETVESPILEDRKSKTVYEDRFARIA